MIFPKFNINRIIATKIFMRRNFSESKGLKHHKESSVDENFNEEIFHHYKRNIIDLRRQASTQIRVMQIERQGNTDHRLLAETILRVLESLDTLEADISFICSKAPNYDFKEVKANGYRSFLMITNKCCVLLLNHMRNIDNANILWHSNNSSDVIAYSECLLELKLAIRLLVQMIKTNSHSDSSLFFDPSVVYTKPIWDLIYEINNLKQEIFYGPTLGFHYCMSAQKILQVLGSIMSGYADSFVSQKSGVLGVLNTVYQSVSYFYKPEVRGQIMAKTTRLATVDFTKKFWNLGEHPLVLEAPNIILPPVQISVGFDLAAEPFSITDKKSGKSVVIPAPVYPKNAKESHSIKLRLTSFKVWKGLGWVKDSGNLKASLNDSLSTIQTELSKFDSGLSRSEQLLVHIHGGGFVAQSAKAHDVYIRSWAERLDCPILSIDYSLAPEYPYPVALQECTFAITWALRNRRQLGCTPNAKVIVCGDSAGANLAITSALRLVEIGVTSLSSMCLHGIFLVYPPSLVSLCPSPARMMSVLDPLLPVGILARCLLAYVGLDEEKLREEYMKRNQVNGTDVHNVSDFGGSSNLLNDLPNPIDIVKKIKLPEDQFMSPLLANESLLRQLPPVHMIDSHLDPLLDDCIELCKKLNQCDVDVELSVLSDLPHGFLNFVLLSSECESASARCMQMLEDLFQHK